MWNGVFFLFSYRLGRYCVVDEMKCNVDSDCGTEYIYRFDVINIV